MLIAALFALAGVGAGAWSLDHAVGIDLTGTAWALGALAVGVAAGLVPVLGNRLLRRLSDKAGRPTHPRPSSA